MGECACLGLKFLRSWFVAVWIYGLRGKQDRPTRPICVQSPSLGFREHEGEDGGWRRRDCYYVPGNRWWYRACQTTVFRGTFRTSHLLPSLSHPRLSVQPWAEGTCRNNSNPQTHSTLGDWHLKVTSLAWQLQEHLSSWWQLRASKRMELSFLWELGTGCLHIWTSFRRSISIFFFSTWLKSEPSGPKRLFWSFKVFWLSLLLKKKNKQTLSYQMYLFLKESTVMVLYQYLT